VGTADVCPGAGHRAAGAWLPQAKLCSTHSKGEDKLGPFQVLLGDPREYKPEALITITTPISWACGCVSQSQTPRRSGLSKKHCLPQSHGSSPTLELVKDPEKSHSSEPDISALSRAGFGPSVATKSSAVCIPGPQAAGVLCLNSPTRQGSACTCHPWMWKGLLLTFTFRDLILRGSPGTPPHVISDLLLPNSLLHVPCIAHPSPPAPTG
jgi:hypothetical protein